MECRDRLTAATPSSKTDRPVGLVKLMSLRLPRRSSTGRKDATRHALLEAALNVFGEKGYHGAAVDEIVDRAGRSKGAAYFHFPSKAAIFRALVRELASQLAGSIERKMDRADAPSERLDAALLGLVDVFVKHRTLARIVLIEVAGAGRTFSDDLIFVRRQFAELIEGELNRAVESGAIAPCDTSLIATAWFGALNEVAVHWLHDPSAGSLHSSYPSLRQLLLQSVGFSPAEVDRVALHA